MDVAIKNNNGLCSPIYIATVTQDDDAICAVKITGLTAVIGQRHLVGLHKLLHPPISYKY